MAGSPGCERAPEAQGNADASVDGTPLEAWKTTEDAAFAEAKKSGRHVMIDFKADWCVPCEKVEAVLAKPQVHRELTEHFVPLALDISDLSAKDNALKAKYKVFELPAVIFVDAQGNELGRFEGQADPQSQILATARAAHAQSPL